ncbi:MAG: hypothetical protein QOE23_1541 [Pseudonocardiales bacterium]|jgi:hypothetical protein|nr:hypothetical protein [Pseudonocardiales bacterium]
MVQVKRIVKAISGEARALRSGYSSNYGKAN